MASIDARLEKVEQAQQAKQQAARPVISVETTDDVTYNGYMPNKKYTAAEVDKLAESHLVIIVRKSY